MILKQYKKHGLKAPFQQNQGSEKTHTPSETETNSVKKQRKPQ